MDNWLKRHNAAMAQPRTREERFFVCMLDLWGSYAGAYFDRYGSPTGEDYVLGPEWQRIGEGMLGLLNGEHGRLDAGTLDAAIRNTIRACGGSFVE